MTDGKLLSGQGLRPEQTLVSVGGQARLHYQGDGNLVVYLNGTPFWASHTDGQPAGGLKMRRDGNLVISGSAGPIASSRTHGHPGAMVQLQDDGNFVIYEDPNGPLAGTPIWASASSAFSHDVSDLEPEPQAQHPNPIVGGLRYGVHCFADANGPVLPVMCHAGDLIGQSLVFGIDRVTSVLDAIADAGYHGMRSWINVDAAPDNRFWGHRPAPRWNLLDNKQRFLETLQAGADRNLVWHLASGGLDGLSNTRENEMFDFLAEAIGQIGPEHFALIEACNEVRDTGDPDDVEPAELERLIQRVRSRHPGLLYSLSSFTGTEDRDILTAFTPSWSKHYYLHGYRGGHVWDKVRHLFSIAYEGEVVRRLGWQGEPFGVGRIVSAQDNGHELDGGAMALGGAMSVMARQAWTFMSGPGVILFDEPLEQMPGFRETPALIHQLPRDLMQFSILGHGGETKRGQRIHAALDDVRADYAIHSDGRYVEIVYGPPNQTHALRKERETRDVTRLLDCQWGRVETGYLA